MIYVILFCLLSPSQYSFFDSFLAEAHLQCPHLLCLVMKLLLSAMKHLQLADLVCAPTRVTVNSSSQIDVLMTTDM